MKKSGSQQSKSPSQLIDARIKELGDWRGEMLSRLRTLVKEADPDVVEEWKWRGVPVVARRIDLHGRDLQERREDDLRQRGGSEGPVAPFNSSLGNTRRAIDFREARRSTRRR